MCFLTKIKINNDPLHQFQQDPEGFGEENEQSKKIKPLTPKAWTTLGK